MCLSVCVAYLFKKSRALCAQGGRVSPSDRVDGLVVNPRVLVHESIAETDDEACVRDARGEIRVATGEHGDGLANDGGLALDRRADGPPRPVGLEDDAGEYLGEPVAGRCRRGRRRYYAA
jgi:hypothetical protein